MGFQEGVREPGSEPSRELTDVEDKVPRPLRLVPPRPGGFDVVHGLEQDESVLAGAHADRDEEPASSARKSTGGVRETKGKLWAEAEGNCRVQRLQWEGCLSHQSALLPSATLDPLLRSLCQKTVWRGRSSWRQLCLCWWLRGRNAMVWVRLGQTLQSNPGVEAGLTTW